MNTQYHNNDLIVVTENKMITNNMFLKKGSLLKVEKIDNGLIYVCTNKGNCFWTDVSFTTLVERGQQ